MQLAGRDAELLAEELVLEALRLEELLLEELLPEGLSTETVAKARLRRCSSTHRALSSSLS